MNTSIKALLALAVIVAASLVGGGLCAVVEDDGSVRLTVPAAPPATAVDGADKDTKRDDAVPLDAQAQEQLEATAETDVGSDPAAGSLRGPDRTEAGVIEGPMASQEWPGCRTAFVRNFSQRVLPVGVIVWHETVSRENGLSSQNALTARANDPVAQVSWHFLIGRTNGLCTYTVPINLKAWHASSGNSIGVGIEVEADGTEPSYVSGAGKAKLFAVTQRVARIYGIPIQHGIVRFDGNCNPTVVREGIIEHHDGGPCMGGHVDVCSTALCHSGGPESAEKLPWRIDPLIRELAAGACAARCKQRKVIEHRDAEHAKTHGLMRTAGCRRRIHSHSPAEFRRPGCRALKRRDVRQRRGEDRARKRLRTLPS